jgi:hypothetical protein
MELGEQGEVIPVFTIAERSSPLSRLTVEVLQDCDAVALIDSHRRLAGHVRDRSGDEPHSCRS